MKKIVLSMIIFCVCLSADAQQITAFWKEKPVSVNNQIFPLTVTNGKMIKDDGVVCTENSDGSYTFELTASQPMIRFVGSRSGYFPIYISDDEDITIGITSDSFEIVKGNVSPENRALMEWVAISRPIYNEIFIGSVEKESAKEFFARFEQMVNQAATIAENLNTGNPEFDAKFKRAIGYAMDFYALSYKMRNNSFSQDDEPDYYNSILTPGKFNDDLVMSLPFGERFLGLLKTHHSVKNGGTNREAFLKLIGSPVLRNKLLYDDLKYISSAYEMRKALSDYANDLDDANSEALNKKLNEIVALNNQEAKDFTFPDIDGNQISLSDFRGKIVLIDVWATWCGPCMHQLPYLLKLEEKFHDNPNLIVMGISVDKQKDYDKWAKMVREGEVKGVQLFTDNNHAFSNDYEIKGIPRFIIVGRDGKFVEYDGPRPSAPLLEELLKDLLEL